MPLPASLLLQQSQEQFDILIMVYHDCPGILSVEDGGWLVECYQQQQSLLQYGSHKAGLRQKNYKWH